MAIGDVRQAMNKTSKSMLLVVLILGLAAGVYWLERPAAPAVAAVSTVIQPDIGKLAEQALVDYRSSQNMQAGPKPGQWKLQAQASNSAGPFVGSFGPLQTVVDSQGHSFLLTTLVADTADSIGESMDSFAASGITRLLLFALQDQHYVLKTERQLEMGVNGMAATARVVQLGPQEWGWVVQSSYTQQGYSASTALFFHADGGQILDMGRLTEQADNKGVCADASDSRCPAPTDLQARWQWVNKTGQRYFPLDIRWQGVIDGRQVSQQSQLLPDANSGSYPFPASLNVQF